MKLFHFPRPRTRFPSDGRKMQIFTNETELLTFGKLLIQGVGRWDANSGVAWSGKQNGGRILPAHDHETENNEFLHFLTAVTGFMFVTLGALFCIGIASFIGPFLFSSSIGVIHGPRSVGKVYASIEVLQVKPKSPYKQTRECAKEKAAAAKSTQNK